MHEAGLTEWYRHDASGLPGEEGCQDLEGTWGCIHVALGGGAPAAQWDTPHGCPGSLGGGRHLFWTVSMGHLLVVQSGLLVRG